MNLRLPDLSILAQGHFPAGLLHRPAIQAAAGRQPAPPVAAHVAAHVAAAQGRSGAPAPAGLRAADPRIAVLPWPRSFQPKRVPGRELPAFVRDPAERFFDRDLSAIRTYQSAELRQLGARALTAGGNLVFAPGAFDPHTLQGKMLLAHELTHALQQRGGRVRGPAAPGLVLVRDPLLDAEAAARAQAFLGRGGRPALQAKLQPGVIQRQHGDWYNNGELSVQELWKRDELELNAGGDNFAYFEFQIYEASTLTIKHVEATTFTPRTGVSYLGFYLLARHAKRQGCRAVNLGTPVIRKDPSSVEREVAESKAFKQSQAAAHIYGKLGFDVSDAIKASRSTITPDQMEDVAASSMRQHRWTPGQLRTVPSSDRTHLLADSSGSGGSSSGCCPCCYLTTACVRHRGLAADGEELTVLRRLRDDHMGQTAERRRQRQRYYDYAPGIVAAIEASPAKDAVYEWIYGALRLAVERVRAGLPGDAEVIYTRATLALERALLEP